MSRLTCLALFLCLVFAPAAEAKSGRCPPGLAKKAVPCVPPGQAKKYYRTWERGDYLDDGDYRPLLYPRRYGLPPLPAGQRYVIVGNRIMVVSDDNYRILSILQAVQSILN
ncbi:MAG: excinuclease ABC subunit A [Proteobacteria bacterium]|nr:excinuclease ABC subunit A [Pseudomonadota bacterium]MBS0573886.1 excinuclease ABC subunit A [Pseudomonadota bacterium]